MDISVRTKKTITGSSHRWIGKTQALEDADTVTLRRAGFDLVTAFPNGVIPSGVVLGRVTATGLYEPYDNAAADGTEVAAGFLVEDVPYDRDSTANLAGALMWWGEVVEAFLPAPWVVPNDAATTAAKADLASKFRFV